ncbi:MAG: hypothetical protein DRN81_02300 [Thermoproteota archaeon]|nr:MAG: hypothetical protein DRN81_02300 [Candidatus Korarchaeota archaeon]
MVEETTEIIGEINDDLSELLEPCPFCGSPAEILIGDPDDYDAPEDVPDGQPLAWIRCSSEDCYLNVDCAIMGYDINDLIYSWNNRVSDDDSTYGARRMIPIPFCDKI